MGSDGLDIFRWRRQPIAEPDSLRSQASSSLSYRCRNYNLTDCPILGVHYTLLRSYVLTYHLNNLGEARERPTAGDEPREFTSRGEGGRVPPFIEKLRLNGKWRLGVYPAWLRTFDIRSMAQSISFRVITRGGANRITSS